MDIHQQYELHVTIQKPGNVEDLRRWVNDYEYTFHQIENFCRDGTSYHEYIATYTDGWERLEDAQASIESFARAVDHNGYIPLRKKIECEPYHPKVVQDDKPTIYWESHTKVSGLTLDEAWKCGFHVSRVNDNPQLTITTRSNTLTRADFELDLALKLHYLMNSGVLVGSSQVEYCMIDTNPALDDRWLKG